ncbi:hypothetical protein ACIGFK_13130 [Streptomyces sp. NPDC085524]|uniref:hypothetical protein n=1 Tax=Streptomyces sp. NPDC085524 TaxID=3365728 RepID=UPI0037D2A3B0
MTTPSIAALPDVAGRCPACNGESLMLADGGYVTCRRLECPQPDAAHEAIEERAGANAYDRAINAPMSQQAAAHLRERLASSDVPRRKIRRREPTLRQQALEAAHDTIRVGQWWLPPAGQADVVDAVLEIADRRAIRIQTILDDTRDRIRKLHRPAHYGGRIICAECSAYDGHTSTDSPPVDHPCRTVTALEPPKETPDA